MTMIVWFCLLFASVFGTILYVIIEKPKAYYLAIAAFYLVFVWPPRLAWVALVAGIKRLPRLELPSRRKERF